MNKTYHYLQLQAAKGFGSALQRRLFTYILKEGLTLSEFMISEDSWLKAGLSDKNIVALKNAEPVARTWLETVQQKKITVISWLDTLYPQDIRRVLGEQAPPILHLWGNVELLKMPAVGFCGARDASEQGLAFAQDTSEQIATKGWAVVSGHAKGVDHTTHKTAIEGNGHTIIVVPTGLFNFHLRADLKKGMRPEQVLIVSEFQPNARWSVGNAMTRNHTICGLSDAMVVVESGTKGGTFAAGQYALKVKVPLFVADYAHPASSAAGNPYFIQRGATPLRRSKETNRTNLQYLIQQVEAHQTKLASPPPPKLMQDTLFS